MAEPIDLSTAEGRKRARYELIWGDHGFLRKKFRNLHKMSDEMWRANQPSPEHIADYAKTLGLKTILNLRGKSPKGYYLLEKEACAEHGIELVDFQVFSRDTPEIDRFLGAKDLFERIKYPALMHCKSGADRAGLMSVLYMHFRMGQPIEEAIKQLSFDYLHIRAGKTGILDYVFECYLRDADKSGKTFKEWVKSDYDRVELKRIFLESRKSKLNLDQILRRE